MRATSETYSVFSYFFSLNFLAYITSIYLTWRWWVKEKERLRLHAETCIFRRLKVTSNDNVEAISCQLLSCRKSRIIQSRHQWTTCYVLAFFHQHKCAVFSRLLVILFTTVHELITRRITDIVCSPSTYPGKMSLLSWKGKQLQLRMCQKWHTRIPDHVY